MVAPSAENANGNVSFPYWEHQPYQSGAPPSTFMCLSLIENVSVTANSIVFDLFCMRWVQRLVSVCQPITYWLTPYWLKPSWIDLLRSLNWLKILKCALQAYNIYIKSYAATNVLTKNDDWALQHGIARSCGHRARVSKSHADDIFVSKSQG